VPESVGRDLSNSSAETKTTTEKGFVEGFAKQIGDIGSIMIAISSTVLEFRASEAVKLQLEPWPSSNGTPRSCNS